MLVSIITPFYKGNSYLERLSDLIAANVVSLKNTPEIKLEWILVNDSPEVAPDRSRIYPEIPFRILTHTENQGIHQARLTGLKASRADWVLFLDQDDQISEEMIRDMLLKADSEQADVLVCNALCETADGRSFRLYNRQADLLQAGNLLVYLMITDAICSPGQCLIRRTAIPREWEDSVLKSNGSDDLMLWIMMLSRKARFRVLPETYYRHTFTGQNVSGSEEQIGSSSSEAAALLYRSGFLSKRQYHVLMRSICWSLRTRKENLSHFYQNLDIIAYRILWKIRKHFSAEIPEESGL